MKNDLDELFRQMAKAEAEMRAFLAAHGHTYSEDDLPDHLKKDPALDPDPIRSAARDVYEMEDLLAQEPENPRLQRHARLMREMVEALYGPVPPRAEVEAAPARPPRPAERATQPRVRWRRR